MPSHHNLTKLYEVLNDSSQRFLYEIKLANESSATATNASYPLNLSMLGSYQVGSQQ